MATITLLLPERTRLPGPLPAAIGRVLGRADHSHGEPGARAQLRRHFRLVPDHWPVAALTRLVDVREGIGGNVADTWLRADPAHVAPDINGARLLGWGDGLGLDDGDVRAFLPALRPLFAYLKADVVPTAVFAASEDFGSTAGSGGSLTGSSLSQRIDRAARELADKVLRRDTTPPLDPFDDPTPFEDLLRDI